MGYIYIGRGKDESLQVLCKCKKLVVEDRRQFEIVLLQVTMAHDTSHAFALQLIIINKYIYMHLFKIQILQYAALPLLIATNFNFSSNIMVIMT